ncbi:thiamine pyrophosphokinase [Pedobacter alpinus]|uniref:Thiamine pyrophosphokinase n=1 Tax=Pedobacter alpinus TaxID=1590643 RepID=A0ABW5TQC4_9SPHI
MSSHHIVREKQEPALLIMDLQHFNEEYLGQLLEWSPMVMVPLHLFEKVVSLGIKIDTVLAKEDPNLLYFQEHVKVVSCDDDILDCALKYLVAERFPAINIISNHFRAKEYQFYVDLIDIVIFKENQKIYPIKSGFSKWKAANEQVFVLQEDLVHQLSISGLEEISAAQYQTEKDGFFSFTFEPPFIFIAEQL